MRAMADVINQRLPLIEAGWVELTLSEKPTSPLQRYRLTGTVRSKMNKSAESN